MFAGRVQGGTMFETVRLLKVSPGQSARVTVQSSTVEIVTTHWFGRQLVCPGVDCPACDCYQCRLAVFFVGTVWTGKVWSPALVELCPSELARVKFMLQWESGCVAPGAVLLLSRKSARASVRAEPIEGDAGNVLSELGSGEVLLNSVCRLFNLPSRRSGEGSSAWSERVRPFLVGRLEKAIRDMG